ncbi:hypothetical protein KGD82_13405 [Nocardiopsis eucommiae]|uniref:Uncharacterized protein n=1 Tax=Nocardiopsis eucommiae TaxID=2831970 RepID=A0A975LC12_9ACTN|nr:hypothetical protein KGD82_13405 [Nocardiopsis eucommiae]
MKTARHGSTGYTKGCRCQVCRSSRAVHQSHRNRMKAYGRPTTDLVNATPARDHVRALMVAGFSLERIAERSEVPLPTLNRLIYGVPSEQRAPSKRLAPRNATAILSVVATLDTLPGCALYDVAGTRRRSLSLAVAGMPLSWQAEQLGYAVTYYRRRVMGADQVSVDMVRRVRALHDTYWDKPRPESPMVARTRRWAEAQGGLPSASWDDDLIDLPDAELEAELARRVSRMSEEELRRCSSAYKAEGRGPPRSPLLPVSGAAVCNLSDPLPDPVLPAVHTHGGPNPQEGT